MGWVVLGVYIVHVLICVWRLSYVVDSCNVVATEDGRYGLFCTYVETVECMSSASLAWPHPVPQEREGVW